MLFDDLAYEYSVGRASDVPIEQNATYNCVMNNMWTIVKQPKKYPTGRATWGRTVIVSHSDSYDPWAPDLLASAGVKKLAETGTPGELLDELRAQGNLTGDPAIGVKLRTGEVDSIIIDDVKVSENRPFLNAISRADPSPCWFSGFYKFDVRADDKKHWWSFFTISTFPWDAGTVPGDSYNSVPDPTLSNQLNEVPISLMAVETIDIAEGPWLSKSMDSVPPVLRWDCTLLTRPIKDDSDTEGQEESTGTTGEEETDGTSSSPSIFDVKGLLLLSLLMLTVNVL